MSMFYNAIVKENTKHQNEGGNLKEIVLIKIKNGVIGDQSIKLNVCADAQGNCDGCLKGFGKLTGQ